MIGLASIQLNKLDNGDDVIVFPADLVRVEGLPGTGSQVCYRDGTKVQVSESVTTIQTAINALWDEYMAAITGP